MLRTLFFTLILSAGLLPDIGWTQNTPPIADAGADQNVIFGQLSTLDGTASFDPDGDTIDSWMWTVVSAPIGSSDPLVGSASPTPLFDADTVGDYEISLVVNDGFVDSLPDFITVSVALNAPPVASATATPTTGAAPLIVSFDGSGSYDPEGGALTYVWDFGDSSARSTAAVTSHEYTIADAYLAQLIVTDEFGERDFAAFTIIVNESTNSAPSASPSATPNSGGAPLLVQFAANASDPDGDPLTYAWDFGDGNSSTVADPANTYANSGNYVAWLTVSDGMDDVSQSITIVVDPAIGLSVGSAKVKFKRKGSAMGSVDLRADVDTPVPYPNDVIMVVFDGVTLFSAPFSSFVPNYEDGEDDIDDGSPLVFKLKDDDVKVKLDLAEGWISVKAKKLILSGLDNANGVDVELHIGGDAVAVENILMEAHDEKKLYYHRPKQP